MKQLDIFLTPRVHEIAATIRGLRKDYNISVSAALRFLGSVAASLVKHTGGRLEMKLCEAIHAPPLAEKAAFPGRTGMSLAHRAALTAIYPLSAGRNALRLGCGALRTQIARRRLLKEMDTDETGKALSLSAFDGMILSEVDLVLSDG